MYRLKSTGTRHNYSTLRMNRAKGCVIHPARRTTISWSWLPRPGCIRVQVGGTCTGAEGDFWVVIGPSPHAEAPDLASGF